MPQKGPTARTWGTRFDTLPSSPPPSPRTRETALVQDVDATNLEANNIKKVEKMPHDASVFVGSLPTNVEQLELTRLLSEHLSEHAEVKSIKLVKDSKGGVCAFVQCQDAAAASSLIHTLHTNAPKPFLGRVLRYEPARAFRTLLISYRTPVQFVPSEDRDKGGQTIQLDPPLAMRMWRPRNSKFLVLQYNAEAVDAENHANAVRDAAGDPGVFLQPVLFDEGSLRKLCAHFGPLGSFALFNDPNADPNAATDQETNGYPLYPHPHNAPRLDEMDRGCFEVKWEHRDDCVSALMTLRRVPHLTVTWAHQPTPFGFEHQHGRFSSNQLHGHGTQYPFHVQNSTSPSQPRNDSFNASAGANSAHSTSNGPPLHGNASTDNSSSAASTSTDDWKRITVPVYDSSASFRSPAFFDAPSNSSKEWNDVDFPPLGDSKGDLKAERGVWVDKKLAADEREDRPPSSLAVVTANSSTMDHDDNDISEQTEEQELDLLDTPALGMSPITPRTCNSQFPTTPSSTDGDFPSSSFHGFEGHEKPGYFEDPKDLDPTTLFVGGLEMYGVDAWDEEKIRAFFGRFGGLESVHVVKPVNGRSAFAFVKFNNTDAPARAVSEEHNRVYHGRAMRVQLRDCNPPRGGSWRYGGRGRGRFAYSAQRRYPALSNHSHEPPTAHFHPDHLTPTDEVVEKASLSIHDESAAEAAAREEQADFAVASVEQEVQPVQPVSRQDQSQSCPVSRRSSPALTYVAELPPQPAYREWYDEPASTTVTPPPHTASVPGAPYPAPYYPPPWAQPYPQQMPYGMPYYAGYPGYPMQGVQPPSQAYASPCGSDASGPASGPPRPWPAMGMYGGYVSYPAAYPTRPPNADTSSPRSQAPLQPTGFIQNEAGTLIPVYQPEALDHYMASNQVPPASTPSAPPNAATWQQYPPPLFPAQAHPIVGMPRPFPPPTGPNSGWVSGQFPSASHSTHISNRPANFRGGYQDLGQGMGPNGRRPAGRRDQLLNASVPNNNRNGAGRGMPSRPRGGGMHHMGQMQHFARPAQFVSGPTDWNQWTATASR